MARRRSGSSGGNAWVGWVLVALIVVGVLVWAGYRQWVVSREGQMAKAPRSESVPQPATPAPRPRVEDAPKVPERSLPGPMRPVPPPEPGVARGGTRPAEKFPLPVPTPLPVPEPIPVPVPAPPSGTKGAIIPPGQLPTVGSTNLFLGNPSNADGTDLNNLLMGKTGYVVSYNAGRGGPNWVSWRLRKEDLGDAPRARYFSPDEFLVKHNLVAIDHKDYTNSGFDRGHLCPHSDRDGTKESSTETFLMTNIIPQSPTLNQKPWAQMENYLREQVADGTKTLFVVAGGVGTGGVGSKGPAKAIAGGKVAVPAKCWKVVVMVSGLPAKPTEIGTNAQTLAVMMPNVETVGLDWTKYRVTIGEVEKETGYSFLGALRPEVAAKLRGAR